MTRNRFPLFLIAILLSPACVFAQGGGSLDYDGARRVGLEPVWSQGVSLGRTGQVTDVAVSVSPTMSYRGSTVVDKLGRRTFFSDRDAASLAVSRGGYDQTMRRVEMKSAELKSRGLEPQTEETEVPDITLYVRTDFGTVAAFDAETGKMKWSTVIGKPGYPSYGIAATDEFVVTLSSANIYLLSAETGRVLDSTRTRGVPSGTPTIADNRIFVPTSRGLIDVVTTDDMANRIYSLGSPGRIDTSVTISPQTVSWSTSDGRIYVAGPESPGIRYHFQSMDQITTSPVYMDKTLFGTSTDGFAYAINEADGDLKWRYSAGGPLQEAPLALDGEVFVTTIDGNMSALDAETGKAKWVATGVKRFVSISDSRVYCVTSGRTLTVFDRESGGRLGSTPLGPIGYPVVNLNSDRVYLVSQTGVLQCFREPGARWPTARKPPVIEIAEEETDTDENVVPVDVPDSPSAEVPAADSGDPFEGMDSGDDTGAADDAGDTGFDDGEDPFGDFGFEDESGTGGGGDAADEDPFADF